MTFLMWAAHELKNIHDLISARSKKYNGEGDELVQIISASEETGITLEQGIRFMMNMKLSRLNYGENAPEDSKKDSVRDMIGYGLLYMRALERGLIDPQEREDLPTPVESEEKAKPSFGAAWKGFLKG